MPRRRPGDAAEALPWTGAHAGSGVEQARIGQRQRRQQDHQRMREGVDGLAEDDAPEAVDVVRNQLAQQALVAEQVDQRDARQHRRRQQRQQGNPPPQALGRDQRALQCVGEQVGQRHDDGGDAEGNLQAVAQQPVEVGAGEHFARRDEATALPRFAAEAAPEDRQQRQQHGAAEEEQQQPLAAAHEQAVTQRALRFSWRQGAVHPDYTFHLRRTPAGCAAAGPPRFPGCPVAACLPAPVRRAARGPAVRPARSSSGSGCRGR
ncbi:hypothetical protein D3C76_994730 [compost metagenome]